MNWNKYSAMMKRTVSTGFVNIDVRLTVHCSFECLHIMASSLIVPSFYKSIFSFSNTEMTRVYATIVLIPKLCSSMNLALHQDFCINFDGLGNRFKQASFQG